jgi:hypothetical protein
MLHFVLLIKLILHLQNQFWKRNFGGSKHETKHTNLLVYILVKEINISINFLIKDMHKSLHVL